jgi:excinuclease ABC subunit B
VLDETRRRRIVQSEYNEAHGINPQTVRKSMEDILHATAIADVKARADARSAAREKPRLVAEPVLRFMTAQQRAELVEQLRTEMLQASKDLEFERAAQLRDEIARIGSG